LPCQLLAVKTTLTV